MKKYYKVASLAIAGSLAASAIVPIAAYAEEDTVLESSADTNQSVDNQSTEPEETASQALSEAASGESSDVILDSAEQTTAEQATEETTVETSEETVEETTVVETTDETDILAQDETNEAAAENQDEAKADEADADSNQTEDVEDQVKSLDELLEEIQEEDLELIEPKDSEDSNEDGLSDLVTKRLCDGEILTQDGQNVFSGHSYEEIQYSDDFDGDGLLNGQEVQIKEDNGSQYAVMVSDPCRIDTDGDGINDADDTAPWEYGLEGGVVGSVRLIARHDESKGDPTHGHVYILYTSYVNNLEISIDKLYGYYVANPEYKARLDAACESEDASIVSWRSTVAEIDKADAANESARVSGADALYPKQAHEIGATGTVTLNRGDYISIGNYGMHNIQETILQDYMPEAKKIFARDDQAMIDLWKAVTGQEITAEYLHAHLTEIVNHLAEDSSIFVDYVLDGTTEGGVWVNRELHNQKYDSDQGPNEIIEREATQTDLNYMLDYFSSNSYFNIFNHNCSTVGTGAWNEAYGYARDEAGNKVLDDNGNAVKTEYYAESSVNTPVGSFNFPSIVKKSIAKMSNLKGYIGSVTYVTGKRLVNTVNEAVKKFDITKLFAKKANTNPVNNQTETNTESNVSGASSSSASNSAASNSSSNGNSGSSSTAAPTPFDGIISVLSSANANEADIQEDTQVIRAAGRSTARRTAGNSVRVAAADLEDEETVVEESEEEIQQKDSLEEEKNIADEETPLAAKSRNNNWLWVVIAAFVAAIGAGITIVIAKRNKYV